MPLSAKINFLLLQFPDFYRVTTIFKGNELNIIQTQLDWKIISWCLISLKFDVLKPHGIRYYNKERFL